MIPVELADKVQAPPGFLLCEREEMPVQARGLWLPDGYRTHTLSGMARIVSGWLYRGHSGDPSTELGPGTYILLTASAGKPFVFGYGGNERTLVRITADSILAVLTQPAETKVKHPDPLPFDADILNYGGTIDAGDPKALR